MKNMKYVRTDKNGTKIYHDYTCDRCGGAGGSDAWKFTGWTCYKCGGTGISDKPTVYKEYTPEYRAILDARAAKRREKKLAKAKEESVAKQAAWKESQGFVNDRIYVVGVENSFDLRDDIKAAGGRYDGYIGWYFSEPHDEYKTFVLTAEESLVEDAWYNLGWVDNICEIVKAKMPSNPSEYIGQVGEKIEREVIHVRTGYFDTQFGTTWVHTFKDMDGNVLVWKTSSSVDLEGKNTFRIKGTVKAHDEYHDIKQTVLIRCKIS